MALCWEHWPSVNEMTFHWITQGKDHQQTKMQKVPKGAVQECQKHELGAMAHRETETASQGDLCVSGHSLWSPLWWQLCSIRLAHSFQGRGRFHLLAQCACLEPVLEQLQKWPSWVWNLSTFLRLDDDLDSKRSLIDTLIRWYFVLTEAGMAVVSLWMRRYQALALWWILEWPWSGNVHRADYDGKKQTPFSCGDSKVKMHLQDFCSVFIAPVAACVLNVSATRNFIAKLFLPTGAVAEPQCCAIHLTEYLSVASSPWPRSSVWFFPQK